MILFKIRLEEERDGKVRMRCETPASTASPQEVAAGLSFKRMFQEWAEKQENAQMDSGWKSPTNEIREDN